jgi:DNA-binding response OmpR family regulator
MLKIGLHIHEPYLLAALQELLPQAGICLKENEKEWDCLLFSPPYSGTFRPALNVLSLAQPLRFLDLLPILESLPYSQEITFSHFTLELREKILKNLKTQESHRLTEKECQLLRFFHQNKGEELSKEVLLQEIWGYHPEAETHTLETHIYRLRQKLEEDQNNPQIILNGKQGYILR